MTSARSDGGSASCAPYASPDTAQTIANASPSPGPSTKAHANAATLAHMPAIQTRFFPNAREAFTHSGMPSAPNTK